MLATPPDRPASALHSLFRLWFGLSRPVGRRAYAASGFGLAALKYLTDAALVAALEGTFWSPTSYLSPLLQARAVAVRSTSTWVVLGLWALPFLWIGASMTFRRLSDARLPVGLGFLFFVPGLNYLLMAGLCLVPSAGGGTIASADPRPPSAGEGPVFDRELVLAVLASAPLAFASFALGVSLFKHYGWALFLGTPFAMGFVAAALYNRRSIRSFAATQVAVQLSLALAAGAFLVFGLEGALCLAMAYPPAAVLALFGSLLGHSATLLGRMRPGHLGLMLALGPLLTAVEGRGPQPPLREVVTAIEINAPPEAVWPWVTAVSEIPPARRWIFRTGIAYPQRARLVGVGVGAIRYCEFSTGPFVEPITHWEPPHRLAFDVTSQPPTMEEWSPYRDLDPPHLTEGLRTRRGEFRLVPLAGGRTRLEGSTWYRLDMRPQLYWTLWSDYLIHQIHLRVLEHIEITSEAGGAAPAGASYRDRARPRDGQGRVAGRPTPRAGPPSDRRAPPGARARGRRPR